MNMAIKRDVAKALRNHKYEYTDNGKILFPSLKLTFAGHFETSVNGSPWDVDHNLVVMEGRNSILSMALDQASQDAAYYIALYSGSITVADGLTAATFTANTTEFINYTEATRVLWDKGNASAGALNNDASPAVFTMDIGGGTIRGAGLLSAPAKSATTGKIIAAANFSVAKVLAVAEELRIKYGITATSV